MASFGEVNRAFWDTQVEKISSEPWIQDLTRQILDHLRSNVEWMGLHDGTQTPAKMLDYACGPGIASKAMLPYLTEIRGIDVSEPMVDRYNADAREAGVSEEQMYAVRGDLMEASGGPLEGQDFFNFDLIIMSMALHHIDDPKRMVAELVGRLKPGGRAVIIDWLPSDKKVPHDHGGSSREQPSSHGVGSGAAQHHEHTPHPGAHTVAFDDFSNEQMQSIFKEAGCSSSDYVLAESPSQVPMDPRGQKHLFFAKGTKYQSLVAMTNPSGLSSRMSNIIAAVLPKIAITVRKDHPLGLRRSILQPLRIGWFVGSCLASTLSYQQGFGGDPKLLTGLASFNTNFRPAVQVEESHIAVAAGASSCLDQLLYSICDTGDSVLVPAPYWNGFDFHLTLRASVNIIPVSCESLLSTLSPNLLRALDVSYDTAPEPSRIKALVFTNPHNPFGQCYSRDVIKDVLRWCTEKKMHFIGDEVYGLSEFRRPRGEEGFVSALNLVSGRKHNTGVTDIKNKSLREANGYDCQRMNGKSFAEPTMNGHVTADEKEPRLASSNPHDSDGDTDEGDDLDLSRVHMIWSLSKDLGCSGLRIATLVSQRNNALLTGVRLLSTPLPSSPSTLLATALISSETIHAIVKLTRLRLGQAYGVVEAQLRRWDVEFVEPRAGVFVWARLLQPGPRAGQTGPEVNGGPEASDDDDWEMQQVERLRETGVLVGMGREYHVSAWPEERGWVRITFAIEEERLREGLRKIGMVLCLEESDDEEHRGRPPA